MNSQAITLRDQNYGIAELTKAEQLLASVQAIPDAKHIADAADAVRMYMKKADLGLANQNRAAAIATKARRKVGELADALEKKLGGRPSKTGTTGSASFTPRQSARKEAGVSKQTMEDWQRLSRDYTDAQIEEAAAIATAKGEEFTTSQILKAKATMARIEKEIKQPFTGFDLHLEEIEQQLTSKYPDPEAAYLGCPKAYHNPDRGKVIKSLCNWFEQLRRAYEQHH